MVPRNNLVVLPKRGDVTELEQIFRDVIAAWKEGELSYFQYSAVIRGKVRHQTLNDDALGGR